MGILEDTFPEHAALLRRNRVVDPVLNEICRDYETLIADLRESERTNGRQEIGHQVELRDSLSGLWEEILAKLGLL